jgi:hypothetical protein
LKVFSPPLGELERVSNALLATKIQPFFFLQNKKSTTLVFLYKGSAFLFFRMMHTAARAISSYKLEMAYLQVWAAP